MSQSIHHVQPIDLDYANPALGKRAGWSIYFASALSLVCLVGTVTIFIEVESVVVTGPVLVLGAILLMIYAATYCRPSLLMFAASHAVICFLFFGLVYLNQWGPRAAEPPFRVLSVGWTILSGLWTASLGWHWSHDRPWPLSDR